MEHSRDEVRRQLVASRTDHTAAMRPWREALMRVFAGREDVPALVKAQLLGVPTRRGFLKIGGVSVLGAAVLAACGSDAADVAESGAASNLTTTTADPAAADLDLQLLRTATSLEILAVNAYQTAIDQDLFTTDDVLTAATLFRDQHDDHRAALQAATVDAGGTEYTEANAFVQDEVLAPRIDALTDEDSAIELALTVETAAAETYAWATGQFSTSLLRQAIMGIGGVEGRHMAVLRGFLGDDQVPDAFLPVDERITEDAFVPSEDPSTTDTTGSGGGGDTTTTTAGDTTTTTGPQTTTSAADTTTTAAG